MKQWRDWKVVEIFIICSLVKGVVTNILEKIQQQQQKTWKSDYALTWIVQWVSKMNSFKGAMWIK